jgi:hypothetical protein
LALSAPVNSVNSRLNRREFIQAAGAIAAGSIVAASGAPTQRRRVSLVVDPSDPIAGDAPVQWAAQELTQSLAAYDITVQRYEHIAQASREDICVLAAGLKSPVAQKILKETFTMAPEAPEALVLVNGGVGDNNRVLFAGGHDTRGLVYALLELADRVRNAADPLEGVVLHGKIMERPANAVRSVMRLFASDVEDKPWFNDREMWPRYLTMLATQRFNRFNLGLGLGYDFLRQVTDAYFLFAYPFLLAVPGYNVRARQLPDAERDRNLEMLKFISEQTVARGLDFQLGLWMHGYEWIDSPKANYTIEGLTHETHGPYCRDALRLLLQKCPAISSVTIRTHGESGVEEGSYDFWKTIFEGVATCGRKVEIDLHPKGLDQTMLDNALATRQPIRISPKFWAEHMGMAYHQADIRDLEVPKTGKQTSRLMNLSEGSRSFMRYGYGDLLREDRTWSVSHRVWPGSQRLLLWGDRLTAAAYSRAFSFCGSDGAEIMEPLTFKGRRGTGIPGDRCGYADATLRTHWDWEKYEYSYRVWGRLLYHPDSDLDPWRHLQKQFGDGAREAEAALANASRILPIITTSHLPSAANNNYWPEMYLNQSLVDAAHPGSYSDTPAPKVFGNVSPLDPQLFSRINDFADELLSGERSGKYSPVEVAQWLDDYATAATEHLAQAALRVKGKQGAEYRRLAVDVAIQAGLGHFFAAKFRSGVLYRIFERTGDGMALESSLDQYRQARSAWAEFANHAKGIYMADVTVGELPQLHGHWLDRLPAIDRDIAAVAEKSISAKQSPSVSVARAVKEVLSFTQRPALACRHTVPTRFVRGRPLDIELAVETPAASVGLYYRHVNQAERFNFATMEPREGHYHASIPAAYTDSPYPLQYYFEVKTRERPQLYPGFLAGVTSQPYFVVRSV